MSKETIEEADEGLTVRKYAINPDVEGALDDFAKRNLGKLTMNGGKGDETVGRVDGSVLTIKETAAVAIARDVIDDIKRHHRDKPLHEVSLLEVAKFAAGRADDRACSDHQVLQEVTRLMNHEIYGNRVARR